MFLGAHLLGWFMFKLKIIYRFCIQKFEKTKYSLSLVCALLFCFGAETASKCKTVVKLLPSLRCQHPCVQKQYPCINAFFTMHFCLHYLNQSYLSPITWEPMTDRYETELMRQHLWLDVTAEVPYPVHTWRHQTSCGSNSSQMVQRVDQGSEPRGKWVRKT